MLSRPLCKYGCEHHAAGPAGPYLPGGGGGNQEDPVLAPPHWWPQPQPSSLPWLGAGSGTTGARLGLMSAHAELRSLPLAPTAWPMARSVLRCAGASQTLQRIGAQEELGVWQTGHALLCGISSNAAHHLPQVEGSTDPRSVAPIPAETLLLVKKGKKLFCASVGTVI